MDVALFIFIGAWLSRMHGGGWPSIPWSLDAWLYALPYGYIVYELTHNPYLCALAYISAVVGKRTGHGNFMDMGTWRKESEDERLEFLIKWLKAAIPVYWYDFIGLAITGVACSFVAATTFMLHGEILYGVILLVSGAGKAVAYTIGWKLERLAQPTVLGEWLTGAIAYAGISCIMFL